MMGNSLQLLPNSHRHYQSGPALGKMVVISHSPEL